MPEIVVRRTEVAPAGAHEHIDLVGYRSPHIAKEPIIVPISRILGKIQADLEEFWVVVDGEKVPVTPGKCSICGHEPYLVTEKDPDGGNLILDLPYG